MKPIVLLLPGDHQAVVISPLNPDSHSVESWQKIKETISEEYVRLMDAKLPRGVEGTLAMITKHPEWKCQAIEGTSIPTWQLVE